MSLQDYETYRAIKEQIASLPVDDHVFVTVEANALYEKIQKDPRLSLSLALVGARLAAEASD